MLSHKLNQGQHASCLVMPIDKLASSQQLAQADTVFLLVRGMGCPACALRVRNALLQIEGVVAAEVALHRGLARVWYDASRVQPELVAAQLPGVADDAMHHYTAHLIVLAGEPTGGNHGSPS
jgi:copper chaperone CopZ